MPGERLFASNVCSTGSGPTTRSFGPEIWVGDHYSLHKSSSTIDPAALLGELIPSAQRMRMTFSRLRSICSCSFSARW